MTLCSYCTKWLWDSGNPRNLGGVVWKFKNNNWGKKPGKYGYYLNCTESYKHLVIEKKVVGGIGKTEEVTIWRTSVQREGKT